MPATDVTLLGATGFTGRLAAEHLARRLPAGARWAIAGRRRLALEEVAAAVEAAGGVRPELVHADTTDQASLEAMAAGTRVVASAVGPYLAHGAGVVRAATEAGLGYVDLTGEPEFVDRMWLQHHDRAVATGARLVHACGFDSVPYDLGVLHAVRGLPDDLPVRVRAYVHGRLGPSAGTVHSAVGQLASLRGSARAAAERRRREARPVDRVVHGAGHLGRTEHAPGWAVPLPTLDPQIVLRSARALPEYGPDFTYEHYAHVRSTRTLVGAALGLGALTLAAQLPPTRRMLLRRMSAGDGPDPAQRAAAWFTLDLFAEAGGTRRHTRVSGRDPGYGGAGRMLAESALCLAFDDLPAVSGQTTTAVAMGQALIDRLHPETLRFERL